MLPHYEDLKKNLEIFHGESGHIRPTSTNLWNVSM